MAKGKNSSGKNQKPGGKQSVSKLGENNSSQIPENTDEACKN